MQVYSSLDVVARIRNKKQQLLCSLFHLYLLIYGRWGSVLKVVNCSFNNRQNYEALTFAWVWTGYIHRNTNWYICMQDCETTCAFGNCGVITAGIGLSFVLLSCKLCRKEINKTHTRHSLQQYVDMKSMW